MNASELIRRRGSAVPPSSNNREYPVAYGDRVDQQVQFVEQAGVEQLADDRDGAADRDVAAGLALQCGDGLDQVALELFGVAPGELELLLRHDELADVAQSRGEQRVGG